MFRLAVAQAPAALVGVEARLSWLADILRGAAAKADLLLLPELFASGYNIGEMVHNCAEPADGAIARQVAGMARESGVAIHYGYPERDGENLFNSAQCIAPDGTRLGGHRKLIIPPGFEGQYFAAGNGCALFSYKGVRIATLICYDAEFPETARHVAQLGAELVLVPTALGAKWGWVADTMIPTRAYENGVFLAYANSAGAEGDMAFLGRSFIAAPDGEELARAGHAPEVITADLNMARVPAAQARLPYLKDRLALSL